MPVKHVEIKGLRGFGPSQHAIERVQNRKVQQVGPCMHETRATTDWPQ